ncbi:MAG TPA: hypothetical protein VFQ84_11510 [Arenimonas sp.]|uniref:hypothetical protein n=1 Tax=Arenimonas sp. TaxID=1872635 RepID=UPI002D7E1D08|nr:hypothetical protein [Arenimonas sp.]HEU0153957.1 hypothetical protein [Arenimonas sp.]
MPESKPPKPPRYQPGMVYAVPLADGAFGLAQAGGLMMPNVVYVALFLDRFDTLPSGPPPLAPARVVSLAATWRRNLNRGDWLALGVAAPVPGLDPHPTEALAASGYVGATHYDAGLLSEFLSACHGALPWNVMHDPAFFQAMLLPGLARPAQAVVLGERERTEYRRKTFGVNA